MIRTMLASALLTLGTGIALGQPAQEPASDNAATPAEPATPADPATPATPADPSTGTAAQPADPATPATAADPATPAQKDETTAAETRAQKKAKRKAACEAIKAGKPRDC